MAHMLCIAEVWLDVDDETARTTVLLRNPNEPEAEPASYNIHGQVARDAIFGFLRPVEVARAVAARGMAVARGETPIFLPGPAQGHVIPSLKSETPTEAVDRLLGSLDEGGEG